MPKRRVHLDLIHESIKEFTLPPDSVFFILKPVRHQVKFTVPNTSHLYLDEGSSTPEEISFDQNSADNITLIGNMQSWFK